MTDQSATASDTQSGAAGPLPSSGSTSPAQPTSFAGSMKVSEAEKAMEKKRIVSTKKLKKKKKILLRLRKKKIQLRLRKKKPQNY